MADIMPGRGPRSTIAVIAAVMVLMAPTMLLAMDPTRDEGAAGGAGVPNVPTVPTPFLPEGVSIPATWYPYLKPPPESRLHPDIGSSTDAWLRVIIQFHGTPTARDLEYLGVRDVQVRINYSALPAVAAVGPREGILALADLGSVRFVEIDEVAVRDMEVSTSVINASRVWSTEVVVSGRHRGPITGSGITCCVVDTGIDAGHPDLDYGDKTLFNMHYDGVNWAEMENSDLSIGHGTHVAGTVAGNGDASAGARRGVAPGGNLIGLSAGNIETEGNYLKCLDWVYLNSRPGFSPYNIKLATNSWHTTVGEYDPNSALSQVIEKLAFENNVLTTWSAGNDGRDDPEGTGITTSQQGTTPVAIMCAAYEHDGSAAAEFTSRGQVGLNHTYPDVGGPGVRIWSCSARRTVISGGTYVGGNTNPYYLAISGTSMSTPHVAGLVALIFQAAPGAGISAIHEDYSGDDPEGWYSNPLTLVHDVELILEATATKLPSTPDHGVPVPDNSTGWGGRPIDYVQGYGNVNADMAVGLALTLQRLRDLNPGRYISVHHALRTYEDAVTRREATMETDRMAASWSGEFSRYNDQRGGFSAVNQTKTVFVPLGATEAVVDLLYASVDTTDWSAGDLWFTIDYGEDGSVDYTSSQTPSLSGARHVSIPVSGDNAGRNWLFDIAGRGVKRLRPLVERSYMELRMEYEMSVEVVMDTAGNATAGGAYVAHEDYRAGAVMYSFVGGSSSYSGGNVTMVASFYDMDNIEFIPGREHGGSSGSDALSQLWAIVAVGIMGIILFALIRRYDLRKKKEGGKGRPDEGASDGGGAEVEEMTGDE